MFAWEYQAIRIVLFEACWHNEFFSLAFHFFISSNTSFRRWFFFCYCCVQTCVERSAPLKSLGNRCYWIGHRLNQIKFDSLINDVVDSIFGHLNFFINPSFLNNCALSCGFHGAHFWLLPHTHDKRQTIDIIKYMPTAWWKSMLLIMFVTHVHVYKMHRCERPTIKNVCK